MKSMETAADKGKFSTAIRAYIDAKNAEKIAKAEAEKRKAEILAALDGDMETNWETDDGRKYRITVTYGKTTSTLNAELVQKILGVEVTPECYKKSRPYDEIRVNIVA